MDLRLRSETSRFPPESIARNASSPDGALAPTRSSVSVSTARTPGSGRSATPDGRASGRLGPTIPKRITRSASAVRRPITRRCRGEVTSHNRRMTADAHPNVGIKHWRAFGAAEWQHVRDGAVGLGLGSLAPVVLFYGAYRAWGFSAAVLVVLVWSAGVG